ncbi:uncharacterized protein A4U43_C04F17710 [Asparagus officinalis]|uniref:PUM-HD domain-containing protein n=1 Tax=Asparagus officinalis TaxID=4686 RepID=A0A5P1F6I6_ASPOF|nr:pumilio homolog 1-like [Asparagus officinalis]ONK72281.1 uncharacterized protein A4U43_C04F17710 [Asparagus officinalis]
MITENSSNFDDFEKDLEALLSESHLSRESSLDRERELNIYRSGSAPPTVEGSRTAIRSLLGPVNGEGLMSDEELRAHPDYLSYYYSNDNLNPRLPGPLMSREDWRVAQRFRTTNSAIGDRRKGLGIGGESSLFSMQPGLPGGNEEKDWGNGGIVGLVDVGLGNRRKSFTDAIQEDLVHLPSVSPHLSRAASHSSYGTSNDLKGFSDVQFPQNQNGMDTIGGLRSEAASPGLVRVQSLGSTMSQSFASAVGSSLSRSTTPDRHAIGSSSSFYSPVGKRLIDAEKKIVSNGFGAPASHMADSGDIAVSLSGLSLSNNIKGHGESHLQDKLHCDFIDQPQRLFTMRNGHAKYLQKNIIVSSESESLHVPDIPLLGQNGYSKNAGVLNDLGLSVLASNGQVGLREQPSMNLTQKVVDVGSNSLTGSNGYYPTDTANIDFVGCNSSALHMLNNQFDEGTNVSSGLEGNYLPRTANQVSSAFQAPPMDPLYSQYVQRASNYATDLNDPSLGRSYLDTNHFDMMDYKKAYLGTVLAQQRLTHHGTYFGKSGGLSNDFYGNSGAGLHIPYPTVIPRSPIRQNEPLSRLPSALRSGTGGSKGSWSYVNGIMEQGLASTLLEEFKTNKIRSFELCEIAEHVVEFSGDQYGSRFIQQKLETASIEEKNKLFPKILAHARVLMTDVFGNYVIQKFFEHGTESHRNQLATQLMGHVLPLSLQMYGCRVIQKALEVVNVDQQTQMVSELDGSVIKCVRDQNGNHVIQKCIECVPQERIQFIISAFYGHVVALSTHPYGCRVIQRVLEHCDDEKTQSMMMEEIMRSVCVLAQDQYGNYVIQHVLQHGKPEERSAIISMLAGQIVKMSQQKFASNVVEKCLTYGTPAERQLLIDEMLGSTDENEPFQAMMKDQFGNYVVQKVLETCDDKNRELILSRVKVHLNALKKYTYGKHIVARVEKLVTAGERRIGMQSYTP